MLAALCAAQVIEVLIVRFNPLLSTVHIQSVFEQDSESTRNKDFIFYWRLNVDRKLMVLFYISIKESFLTFSLICWCGDLNVPNRNQLGNVVKTASKITGEQQLSLSFLARNRHRKLIHRSKSGQSLRNLTSSHLVRDWGFQKLVATGSSFYLLHGKHS